MTIILIWGWDSKYCMIGMNEVMGNLSPPIWNALCIPSALWATIRHSSFIIPPDLVTIPTLPGIVRRDFNMLSSDPPVCPIRNTPEINHHTILGPKSSTHVSVAKAVSSLVSRSATHSAMVNICLKHLAWIASLFTAVQLRKEARLISVSTSGNCFTSFRVCIVGMNISCSQKNTL